MLYISIEWMVEEKRKTGMSDVGIEQLTLLTRMVREGFMMGWDWLRLVPDILKAVLHTGGPIKRVEWAQVKKETHNASEFVGQTGPHRCLLFKDKLGDEVLWDSETRFFWEVLWPSSNSQRDFWPQERLEIAAFMHVYIKEDTFWNGLLFITHILGTCFGARFPLTKNLCQFFSTSLLNNLDFSS